MQIATRPVLLICDEPTDHLSVSLVDDLTAALSETPAAVVARYLVSPGVNRHPERGPARSLTSARATGSVNKHVEKSGATFTNGSVETTVAI